MSTDYLVIIASLFDVSITTFNVEAETPQKAIEKALPDDFKTMEVTTEMSLEELYEEFFNADCILAVYDIENKEQLS